MISGIEEQTFGAVVLILKDTGSALGFVIFKERFTFWVKGPLRKGCEVGRKGKKKMER
jgi:hypothetical protein